MTVGRSSQGNIMDRLGNAMSEKGKVKCHLAWASQVNIDGNELALLSRVLLFVLTGYVNNKATWTLIYKLTISLKIDHDLE